MQICRKYIKIRNAAYQELLLVVQGEGEAGGYQEWLPVRRNVCTEF